MDAIRQAKIEVLIPILEAVEEAVHDLVEEDAVHGTHGNLRETAQAQRSSDAFDALYRAWDRFAGAIEDLKEAVGVDEPELPATPPKPIIRRHL
jgi:hypothetical protein